MYIYVLKVVQLFSLAKMGNTKKQFVEGTNGN